LPARAGLYVAAVLVVVGLVLDSLARGHSPESFGEWFAPVGPAVTIAAAGLWVFDRWGWRQPGIRQLLGRPVLHGTWRGELASSWVDPETGKQREPDWAVFLVVRQRFWSVSVRLLTKESKSESLFAELAAGEDGVCQLLYIYANQPQAKVEHRSKAHYGAVVLNAPRNRADGIEGQYFTGRKTIGDMRFPVHHPEVVETYEAALTLRRS
jgi:hypothetical protein